jgi:hypothetical protein
MDNIELRDDAALAKLSRREKKYWKIIRTNSGVLNLVGKPGLSKTSTLRSMAEKLNLKYVDLRLTTLDETDLGCYPRVKEINGFDIISYAIPDWAWESNKSTKEVNEKTQRNYDGALIVFEELNRANITLRNASLKILLEKEIGTKFKFNDKVYMAATGNLGADDDTDVEEFDSALKSRLIRVTHDLPMNEWLEEFANEHIHKDILYFLKHNPSFYYPDFKNEDTDTITNPRTWTFLSDYIIKNFGKDSIYNNYAEELTEVGSSFINSSTFLEFMRFTKEKNLVSYKDILKNKNDILKKENFMKLDRDVVSRLLLEVKELNMLDLTKKEVENFTKFLGYAEEEQRVTFLFDMVSDYKYDNDNFKQSAKNNLVNILNSFPVEKEVVKRKLNS